MRHMINIKGQLVNSKFSAMLRVSTSGGIHDRKTLDTEDN